MAVTACAAAPCSPADDLCLCVQILSEGGRLPERGSLKAAGYDLFRYECVSLSLSVLDCTFASLTVPFRP